MLWGERQLMPFPAANAIVMSERKRPVANG